MRELVVKEQVRIRCRGYDEGWLDWWDTDDDFETACQKTKERKKKNIWNTYQVAKFYYDLDGNYLGWNDGIVIP